MYRKSMMPLDIEQDVGVVFMLAACGNRIHI